MNRVKFGDSLEYEIRGVFYNEVAEVSLLDLIYLFSTNFECSSCLCVIWGIISIRAHWIVCIIVCVSLDRGVQIWDKLFFTVEVVFFETYHTIKKIPACFYDMKSPTICFLILKIGFFEHSRISELLRPCVELYKLEKSVE